MNKVKKFFKSLISEEESGAIVIETTIAFALFLWFVFVIFSLLHVVRVQSAVTRATHQFAMDLSQTSYIFYEFVPGNKELGDRNSTYTEVNQSLEDVQGAYSQVNEKLDLTNILSAGTLLNQALNGITDVVGGADGDSTSSQIGNVLVDLAANEITSAVSNLLTGEILKASLNLNLRFNSMVGDVYLDNFKADNFGTGGSSLVGGPLHLELTYDIGIRGLTHFFPGMAEWKIPQGVSAYTNPWRGK